MEPISILVLTATAKAIIGALVGKTVDATSAKLRGDPARKALELALGCAIQSYATNSMRLDVAQPLLQENGFLTEPIVAAELAQVVRFDRDPDTELIGREWKAALEDPPQWRDFTDEAEILLQYLKKELRGTEVFRPVFDAKRLDAIDEHAAVSAKSLANIAKSLAAIEAQLDGLRDLLEAGFGDFINLLNRTGIRNQILDYTSYIEDKTRGFVGRQFVFDKIAHFIENNPRGYFFLRARAGIGKSAIAAQMVKTDEHVHHFNIRSKGISRANTFLRNVCAQLIAAYGLDQAVLSSEMTQRPGGDLEQLLDKVSDGLGPGEKAVIVVDALDEADSSDLPWGTNPLYLPPTVPQGIYFVVTTQPRDEIMPSVECEQEIWDLKWDDPGNKADIREYIEQALDRPGIQDYVAAQEIDDERFVEHLVEKSQGNFMYLRYVLPEIENGWYKDLGLEAIPAGLANYYEDNWRRMRGQDEEAWFKYKLPIIVALTLVKEPVSIDLIAIFSGVQQRARILAVLNQWRPFLEPEVTGHRIYHESFHDFLARKGEIKEGLSDL